MNRITPITEFDAPLGGHRVELQRVDRAAGGMSLLRVRIREGSRYTVFDIDPAAAGSWGRALLAWAEARAKEKAA
jgi:hypothetical protein